NLMVFYYTYDISKTSYSPEYFGLLYYNELQNLSFDVLANVLEKQSEADNGVELPILNGYGYHIINQVKYLLLEEGYIRHITANKFKVTPNGTSKVLQGLSNKRS
ncbi:MAG: hypothetical protein P0116_04415, partial [Candidatus Nitrosocosmicus sp.]|nr:hypothetical protein [Candidatus Nitrosocosmicus sp.]